MSAISDEQILEHLKRSIGPKVPRLNLADANSLQDVFDKGAAAGFHPGWAEFRIHIARNALERRAKLPVSSFA